MPFLVERYILRRCWSGFSEEWVKTYLMAPMFPLNSPPNLLSSHLYAMVIPRSRSSPFVFPSSVPRARRRHLDQPGVRLWRQSVGSREGHQPSRRCSGSRQGYHRLCQTCRRRLVRRFFGQDVSKSSSRRPVREYDPSCEFSWKLKLCFLFKI